MLNRRLIIFFLLLQIVSLIVADQISYKKQQRILNGVETSIIKFPHQVSLRLSEDSKHFCGGAILSKFWIITAAQCTQGPRSLPENIYVIVGATNITQADIRYDIEKIVNHPDFNWNKKQNDISMLKTKGKIRMCKPTEWCTVFPVSLPTFETNYFIENGIGLTTVLVSGWGSFYTDTSEIQLSERLRSQESSVLARKSCRRHLGHVNGLLLNENHLCTGVRQGQGICIGDVGNPLITKNRQLVGIASYSGGACGQGYPDVYTRVYWHIRWIWSNLIDH